jgi:hypothetical protein
MSKTTDWMPGTRDEQLAMAKDWAAVMAPRLAAWGLTRDLMRKKDVIAFDYADSGKTAYFAVQIENDGKKGEWGPMVSALIP